MASGKIQVTTYDPKKLSVIANNKALTGYAPDGVVTITKSADDITPVVGVHGDVAYSINADNTAVVAVTLMSTSSSLHDLRALSAARKQFPLSIIDSNDDDPVKLNSSKCMIQKMPDIPRTKDPTAVTINIHVPTLDVK